MKKLLLGTAAIAALAFVVAAPARADEPALKLGVSGFIMGYGVYTDQDETGATDNLRSFDFRKSTEVLLSGEVALDNGITAGAEVNILADRVDGGSTATIDESYFYLASNWGRINFGEADGITGLLQVAAPSADENIDGYDSEISTFLAANIGGAINYKHNDNGSNNKFTYIAPVFSGLQLGLSFTPTRADLASTAGSVQDDDAADLENGMEVAARYERDLGEGLAIALGAGYAKASQEVDNAGDDDQKSWNAGIDLDWNAFGLGASYVTTNNALDTSDSDTDTIVVGADYTTGPYKLGVSYLNRQSGDGFVTGPSDEEIDRWTAGAIYEWGPGMTFRGSVQFQDADNVDGVAADDRDGTQVAVGTQLNF